MRILMLYFFHDHPQEDWNLLQYACAIGDGDAMQFMIEQRKADANFQTQVRLRLGANVARYD